MTTTGGPAIDRAHAELARALGPGGLVTEAAARATYACDGLTGYRMVPAIVTLPTTTAQVARIVTVCARLGVPFVARGAGTGLSGGALPVADGVLIVLSRMRKILSIDVANRRLVAQPGVTNLELTRAVAADGLYYAPDPSSQVVCTIGGNVAENSGGAHCLKYGFTTNHVLGLQIVLPDGTVTRMGGAALDEPGYDLRGVMVGSEGTLGIVTEVTVRLLARPQRVRTFVADFTDPSAAGDAVGNIVRAGILPAAVELLDNLAIAACETATGAGYSREAGAALVVEVDGVAGDVDDEFAAAQACCRVAGATGIRVAADEAERTRIWAGRKAAFAAMGRLSPDYFVQDGVIPRQRLGPVLAQVAQMAAAAGLRVANVFHAGDGNLHPLVLYDRTIPGQAEQADALATAIIELCVAEGGSITGEHGVGVDKACALPRMFSRADLAVMARVRAAFDPDGICNPGKVLPTPRLCGERPGPYRPHPLEAAGVIERL